MLEIYRFWRIYSKSLLRTKNNLNQFNWKLAADKFFFKKKFVITFSVKRNKFKTNVYV